MARVKLKGRGGPRPGAGRPRSPEEDVRRHRVTVLVTSSELEQLQALAAERALPLGTVAYMLLARALVRRL